MILKSNILSAALLAALSQDLSKYSAICSAEGTSDIFGRYTTGSLIYDLFLGG
jgi:hypothetical protein